MDISVIGCGRWGSFIAWYLGGLGHDVLLYGRESSSNMRRLREEGGNGMLAVAGRMSLTCDLERTLDHAKILVISIDSQSLRGCLAGMPAGSLENKTIVLCMKGIEISTGKRLTQVVNEFLPASSRVAIWVGPGHVEEFTRGVPNCMVIDSDDEDTKRFLVDTFSGPLIRFYYGSDLIGNEIGAASKNVIGIAAGMLDGLGLSSLKGALMSRGTREIARLIEVLGGNGLTAYGLSHLGDYEATVFSRHSHNRSFGELFVRGEPYGKLAEGYYTVQALSGLSKRTGAELPICGAVEQVVHCGADPREALNALFMRSLKREF